jgi:tetratricopeptide (TPR) repeat protein
MRPADAHLNPQEFDLALFGVADSSNSNASKTQALDAQQHLKTCVVCQATAEKYRNAEEILNGLRTRDKTSFPQGKEPERGTECPVEQTWLLVSAGLIPWDEAKVYVAHAATCDWCGPLLKEAMEDLAQDVTPEEEQVLADLQSASPAWQREMGRKLAAAHPAPEAAEGKPAEREKSTAASRHKQQVSIFRSLRFVWVNAVVALLVIAVSVGWWMTREPDVNQLLAQSYQERRILQLRISGAKYSPIHVKRGPNDTPPASLRSAESRIRQGLEKSPQNQSLLHQKGRAELLEGDYGAAIATLQQAKDLGNGNRMIAVDLATAYFQKAAAEGNLADYRATIQSLSTVLQQYPDDEIALFNRAIVYERLSQDQDAIHDWERYLRVTRDKEWDGEAQQYLAELKGKLR